MNPSKVEIPPNSTARDKGNAPIADQLAGAANESSTAVGELAHAIAVSAGQLAEPPTPGAAAALSELGIAGAEAGNALRDTDGRKRR